MKSFVISIVLVVGITLGCNKNTPRENAASAPDGLSRAEKAPPPPPVKLVHGQFRVTTYKTFEFEVPAHAITPRLEGNFEASGSAENSAANIDLLVMTPDEFDQFSHGRGGTASYSVTSSPAQTIDYVLPSPLDSSQKYYVVFRNPAGKQLPKLVKADLTVSF